MKRFSKEFLEILDEYKNLDLCPEFVLADLSHKFRVIIDGKLEYILSVDGLVSGVTPELDTKITVHYKDKKGEKRTETFTMRNLIGYLSKEE